MAQLPVELILMKECASYLAMPIFLVDGEGNLLYYNEPAEEILGLRYDETGEMRPEEWGSRWEPTDDRGERIALEELPLTVAVRERRPAHGQMNIVGLDGTPRRIEITAFPLEGQGERRLGAVAVFWEDRGA